MFGLALLLPNFFISLLDNLKLIHGVSSIQAYIWERGYDLYPAINDLSPLYTKSSDDLYPTLILC